MSLVIYNNDNGDLNVVLHDPSRDAMIVHDANSNRFQLIKTNNGASPEDIDFNGMINSSRINLDVDRSSDSSESANDAPYKCSHCGSVLGSRRPSSSRHNSSSSPFTRRRSDVFNNRFNRNYKYMNNNYFKLLALSSNVDEEKNYQSQRELGNGGQPKILSLDGSGGPQSSKKYNALTSALSSSDGTSASSMPLSASSSIYEELPTNLFTQDYFVKFFKIDKLLGRGSNAVVYKVEHFINNFSLGFFAVKKIPIGNDTRGLTRILREVELLCLLSTSNKNLVKYNHVWLEISQTGNFGPKVPCAFILTEYCDGGNLEDMVNNLRTPKEDVESRKRRFKLERERKKLLNSETNGPEDTKMHKNNSPDSLLLTTIEILKFFRDIVTGVYELHSNHIIHRDLKPSNCLISTRYEGLPDNLPPDKVFDEGKYRKYASLPSILVSDFGESQFEGKKRNCTGATGTLEFTAPELLLPASFKFSLGLSNGVHGGLNEFTKQTDMFGLGMILFFMCFGRLPYATFSGGIVEDDLDYSKLRKQIIDFDIAKFAESDTFKQDYYRDDLPDEIYQLLKQLLHRDPTKRVLTSELLKTLTGLIARELSPDSVPLDSHTFRLLPHAVGPLDEDSDEDVLELAPDDFVDKELSSELHNLDKGMLVISDQREKLKGIGGALYNMVYSLRRNFAERTCAIAKIFIILAEAKVVTFFINQYYSTHNSSLLFSALDTYHKHNHVEIESSDLRSSVYVFCDLKLLVFNVLLLGVSISTKSITSNLVIIGAIVIVDVFALMRAV